MYSNPTSYSNGFGEADNNVGFGFNAAREPQKANQTKFGSSPNVVTNSGSFSSGLGSSNVRTNATIHASNTAFGGPSQHNSSSAYHDGASAESSTLSQNSQHCASSVRNPFRSDKNGDKANGLTFGSSSNVVRATAGNDTSHSRPSFVPPGGWGNSVGRASDSRGSAFPNHGHQTSSFPDRTFGGTSETNTGFREGVINPFKSISEATHSFPSKKEHKAQNQGTSQLMEDSAAATSRSTLSNSRGNDDSDQNGDCVDISLDEQAQRLKAKMEERKLLQKKIEEKKRKLLEKRKKQSNRSTLSEVAPSFGPGAKADPVDRDDVKQQPREKGGEPVFRKWEGDKGNSKMRDLLPVGIKKSTSAKDNPDVRNEREDLKNAVALVGTCLHMCPDDELLRREREKDIQLLEIPMPGTLHPRHWTLRNTVIKRFRRSAADYKLDVPQWVRPPDVLENVCGYLEEWVMDRDRQGPDPRFPRQQAPQPLDVYQFIWNRTRMIRKDFTLQNYVGTGGKCDARAVRCHERIARWHAMCEHQLSHIPEFTKMQSQQNIQELGQTMKTLNQFYDDELNRTMVEEPDEFGIETRMDLSPYSHGCSADSVQGVRPCEFDGSILRNENSGTKVTKRLIGKHAVPSCNHGTAETEMRGLYILLTINNDGGMEVLKYAARLFKERPSIYNSKPVQLAMDIYKAKKEYNYIRFFQILKSPTTPYLFGCIMFKYVELMRKVAIRIMSKTYGVRRKDSGDRIYDEYPLKRFRDLLCYEDDDEARHACKHYNITVKAMEVESSESSSVVIEYILWRKSDFKEPIHPEKGYKLPLLPRKMMKTIECKHLGATRLGICRGEASIGDAVVPALAPDCSIKMDAEGVEGNSALVHVSQSISKNDGNQDILSDSRVLGAKTVSSNNENKEGRGERVSFLKDQSDEDSLIEQNRAKQHTEKRVARDRHAQTVAEAARIAEEEQMKIRAENNRKEKENEARRKRLEETRKKLELETRKKLQIEAQRKFEVAERQQRERELLRRKQEKERAEEKRLEAEMQRRKAEAEARRLAAVAQAMELQKLKQAEERRRKQMQRDLIVFSRKKLLMARWVRRLSRDLESIRNSRYDLQSIDPTFVKSTLYLESFERKVVEEERSSISMETIATQGTRSVLETLLRHGVEKRINMSQLVSTELATIRNMKSPWWALKNAPSKTRTILLKLGIVLQCGGDTGTVRELIRFWISSALEAGKIHVSEGSFSIVQSVTVIGQNDRNISDCDLVLCIVPFSGRNTIRLPEEQSAVLHLCDQCSDETAVDESRVPAFYPETMSREAFEMALLSACTELTKVFLRKPCFSIQRMHIFSVATQATIKSLWMPLSIPTNTEDGIIRRAKAALLTLSEEFACKLEDKRADWQAWPPDDFVSSTGMVHGYFSRTQGLPVNWFESLDQINVEVSSLLQIFDSPLRDVVAALLGRDAPRRLKDDCASMLPRRQFRGCLEKALRWRERQLEVSSKKYVYFPSGLDDVVLDGIDSRLSKMFPSMSPGSKRCYIPPKSETNLLTGMDFQLPTGDQNLALNGKRSLSSAGGLKLKVENSHSSEANKRKKLDSQSLQLQNASFPRRKIRRIETSKHLLESSAFSKRLVNILDVETLGVQIGDKILDEIGKPPSRNSFTRTN